MNHPMKEAIIGIVGASHFARASGLWQLQLIPLLEQMEYYNHLLLFEGVLFSRNSNSWLLTLLFLVFRRVSPDNSKDMVSFPFDWEDCAILTCPLLFIPHFPLGMDDSNILANFSAISACSTSSFQVWALTATHANLYLVQKVVPICLQQHGQWHPRWTHQRDSWTIQCNHGSILLSSAWWKEVYPWLP